MKKILLAVLLLTLSACTSPAAQDPEIPSSQPYELVKYESQSAGFSISYPSTWSLQDDSASGMIYLISAERLAAMQSGSYHGRVGDFLIQIYGGYSALPGNEGPFESLEEFLSPQNTYTLNDKKVPYEHGGATGFRNVYSPFDGSEVVYLEYEGRIFEINQGDPTEFQDVKEEILNSISFE